MATRARKENARPGKQVELSAFCSALDEMQGQSSVVVADLPASSPSTVDAAACGKIVRRSRRAEDVRDVDDPRRLLIPHQEAGRPREEACRPHETEDRIVLPGSGSPALAEPVTCPRSPGPLIGPGRSRRRPGT